MTKREVRGIIADRISLDEPAIIADSCGNEIAADNIISTLAEAGFCIIRVRHTKRIPFVFDGVDGENARRCEHGLRREECGQCSTELEIK